MKKIIVSIVSIFSLAYSFAQELPRIITPPPTAFELTKQGSLPIGLNTGTPSVNIPIDNYSTPNINVPINLSYSSNGIKVNQLTSNVGLGWSLNIGGVISRVVRGKEDESHRLSHPIKEINRLDVSEIENLVSQPTNAEEIDVDPDIVKFLYEGGNYDSVDTESDLFSYSFMGMSGKIVFDNIGNIRTIPHSNLRIVYNLDLDSKGSGFLITAPNGVRYYFSNKEILYSRSNSNIGPVSPPEQGYTSSWYLTKVEHPKGDFVNFIYDEENIEERYVSNISQSLELPNNYPWVDYRFPNTSGIVTTSTDSRVLRKRLVEINGSSEGRMIIDHLVLHPDPSIFNYRLISKIKKVDKEDKVINEVVLDYISTDNHKFFLNNVQFPEPKNRYSFEYNDMNSYPKRFSNSQDFWGYYNGENNMTILPDLEKVYPVFNIHTDNLANRDPNPDYSKIGLLNKVIYPSKGYSELIYESNDYYGSESVYTSQPDVQVSLEGSVANSVFFRTVDIGQDAEFESKINFSATFFSTECEDDGIKSNNVSITEARGEVKLYDITNNILVFSGEIIGNNGYNESVNIEPDTEYKLEIINETHFPFGDCVRIDAKLIYSSVEFTKKNIITGGNRIKYAKDYGHNGEMLNSKRYYYSSMDDLNTSSGDAYEKGLGHVSSRISYISDLVIRSQPYISLSSSGRFPITNSGSSNVYYRKVTVSNGGDNFENGGEEHKFNLSKDGPGEVLLGSESVIPNFTNFGWSNGLEKSVKFFKKPDNVQDTKTVVKEITNNYVLDSTIAEVANYYISKKYDFVVGTPVSPTYKCKANDLEGQTYFWQCTTNHSHRIATSDFGSAVFYSPDENGLGPVTVNNMRCRKPYANSNNVLVHTINHQCYGKEVDDVVSYPNLIRNLSVVKYKSNSYWYYLNQKIEAQYDVNGENPIVRTTNYYYDNENHLLPTRTEITNSKGEILQNKTYYAHDLNDQQLIDEHRIAESLKLESYKDGVLLSTQETEYASDHNSEDLYLPKFIKTLKGSSENNVLEERIVYHNYDDKGNPLEVSKKDGTHIVYIWGYNQTQPIAKIENTTYSQVSSYLLSLQTLSDADDDRTTDEVDANGTITYLGSEGALRAKLQELREALPGAQVTSFTYDPLIGVTSITDPRGQTVYYEYDEFNRLEFVKDKDGNILSENKYNYKN